METGRPIGESPPVKRHVNCIGCGYDLFGLPAAGDCPECGLPVQRSRVRLPLDSDLQWQAQIEKGLLLEIWTATGWTMCAVLGLIAQFFGPAGLVLLVAAIATVVVEHFSRKLLWETPGGCAPLVSSRSATVAWSLDFNSRLGLLLFAGTMAMVGPYRNDVARGLTAVGYVAMGIGSLRTLPLYALFIAIMEAIGSERQPKELARLRAVRLVVETLFFGVLITFGIRSIVIPGEEDLDTLVVICAVAYCIVQPFVIGSTYDMWRRMQFLRRLEQDELE